MRNYSKPRQPNLLKQMAESKRAVAASVSRHAPADFELEEEKEDLGFEDHQHHHHGVDEEEDLELHRVAEPSEHNYHVQATPSKRANNRRKLTTIVALMLLCCMHIVSAASIVVTDILLPPQKTKQDQSEFESLLHYIHGAYSGVTNGVVAMLCIYGIISKEAVYATSFILTTILTLCVNHLALLIVALTLAQQLYVMVMVHVFEVLLFLGSAVLLGFLLRMHVQQTAYHIDKESVCGSIIFKIILAIIAVILLVVGILGIFGGPLWALLRPDNWGILKILAVFMEIPGVCLVAISILIIMSFIMQFPSKATALDFLRKAEVISFFVLGQLLFMCLTMFMVSQLSFASFMIYVGAGLAALILTAVVVSKRIQQVVEAEMVVDMHHLFPTRMQQ